MKKIECPFAPLYEECNCPYQDDYDYCDEFDVNVGNGDAWCSRMIEMALRFKDFMESETWCV